MSQHHLTFDAEATVTFLPTIDGGHTGPALSGYRSQFYYGGSDFVCLCTFPDVAQANPGDTVRTLISFLTPARHSGSVFVGTPFLFREGRRIVAYGSITALLDLESSVRRGNQLHAV
jgi:translation elongation factor EF-Tu-like GTPase